VRPDWAAQDFTRTDFTRRQQWAETLALLHEQHVPTATMRREHSTAPFSRRLSASSPLRRRETLQPLTEDGRLE
jgi:hypothetical protein